MFTLRDLRIKYWQLRLGQSYCIWGIELDLRKSVTRQNIHIYIFFLSFYSFIVFWERGREWERGKETSMPGCLLHAPQLGTWPTTQACALTENQTEDPLVCRPVLNPQSHTSQGYVSVLMPVQFMTCLFCSIDIVVIPQANTLSCWL